MEHWKETITKIRQVKMELSATSPHVGPAVAPRFCTQDCPLGLAWSVSRVP